jgi:acetylornithine/N-succinyldiaminopimelate aminotransferase
MAMKTAEVQALYAKYVLGNYTRAPIAMVRGQGSYVWDADGKRYLDLLPGLGVNGLGHCPPAVVAAIQRQAETLMHIHNNYLWEQQARLGQALVERNPGMGEARAFFCNSGTEASEAAIKLARLYGKQHGGKWKLISVQNGFHGRSYGALSATGQTNLQKGCEPMLPGFAFVPLNDAAALEKAFDAETIGFMVEPVQGEGGIFIATKEYLQAARQLCDRHGALLMYDEVQCGLGRTGDYFAYQTLQAPPPDVIWLARPSAAASPWARRWPGRTWPRPWCRGRTVRPLAATRWPARPASRSSRPSRTSACCRTRARWRGIWPAAWRDCARGRAPRSRKSGSLA